MIRIMPYIIAFCIAFYFFVVILIGAAKALPVEYALVHVRTLTNGYVCHDTLFTFNSLITLDPKEASCVRVKAIVEQYHGVTDLKCVPVPVTNPCHMIGERRK